MMPSGSAPEHSPAWQWPVRGPAGRKPLTPQLVHLTSCFLLLFLCLFLCPVPSLILPAPPAQLLVPPDVPCLHVSPLPVGCLSAPWSAPTPVCAGSQRVPQVAAVNHHGSLLCGTTTSCLSSRVHVVSQRPPGRHPGNLWSGSISQAPLHQAPGRRLDWRLVSPHLDSTSNFHHQ